ncbi:hypothetical protein B296_00058791 [Ensete ventricosum]|uniref:Uncharacterized protein n=1 Tax=Ensete ventricosum TaxID=4639 RepID=A0A426XAJ2_ENSVE|nr:hypothetical protein B296_00058791 [Ensete ventricosum]
MNSVHRYGPFRRVSLERTGSPVDWYTNRSLLGGTTNWGYFRPVTTRNQPLTVDFDCWRPISGDISRGGRKKKRDKKNLETALLFARMICHP